MKERFNIECDLCKSKNVETFEKIKNGKTFKFWKCNSCNAQIMACKKTGFPVGHFANAYTRDLRRQVHEIYDEVWKKKRLTRTKLYELIAHSLGVSRSESHISKLNDEQLQFLIKNKKKILKNASKDYMTKVHKVCYIKGKKVKSKDLKERKFKRKI